MYVRYLNAPFQYLMKLHYSQTFFSLNIKECTVSVPYEITLLSNYKLSKIIVHYVSVPYEITLLSNTFVIDNTISSVSVPYEITLLSNLKTTGIINHTSFSTL